LRRNASTDRRQPLVSQQICYTFYFREAKLELVPIAVDQGSQPAGVGPARQRENTCLEKISRSPLP
jgi:hypothetical protein